MKNFLNFLKIGLACNLTAAGLVITGTIVGGVTLNPVILGVISGSGVLLKIFAEN